MHLPLAAYADCLSVLTLLAVLLKSDLASPAHGVQSQHSAPHTASLRVSRY